MSILYPFSDPEKYTGQFCHFRIFMHTCFVMIISIPLCDEQYSKEQTIFWFSMVCS